LEIECGELLQRLGDDQLLVLDTRCLDDWNSFSVHVPGALRLSVTELSECAHVLPDDELIVLCGFSSDGSDARRAERLLRLRGRESVILIGGLRGWIGRGYPTERHEQERQLERRA
jgi:rhodanese-related sulfurtransferase